MGGCPVRILLCHECIVFRYGVDRVLLLLARGFRQLGCEVTPLGQRFDATSEGPPFSDRVLRMLPSDPTMRADVDAVTWLAGHWEEFFGGGLRPDIVVTAGWPFLSAVALFESRGCRVVYQDHGIIPTEGYPEIGWRTLQLLRELKEAFVPLASAVVAVSDFVRREQSAAVAAAGQRVELIANGVDHA